MIYLDNAATTASTIVYQNFYNPSSPHALGIKADRALRDARNCIENIFEKSHTHGLSSFLSQRTASAQHAGNVIFTSGGTEANNMAILGYSLAKHNAYLSCAGFEHPSILAPMQFAHDRNWATKTNTDIPMQGNVLVSISHVNHETGDIADLDNIAAKIKKDNPDAIIHVDGVQGFCKLALTMQNIDMYTFSGHKIHGVAGVGGIWVRKGCNIVPLQHGGGQESGWRSGTENVSGIVQMAQAAQYLHKDMDTNYTCVAKLKEIMRSLAVDLPDTRVNAISEHTSPYILNMSFLGVKGEVLVHALSEKGVFVSMGAACRSRKRARPALELMGFSTEIAESAIRFSFSHYNTIDEVEQARDIVLELVHRFRRINGLASIK